MVAGGFGEFEDAQAILRLGFEKIILNSYAVENLGSSQSLRSISAARP